MLIITEKCSQEQVKQTDNTVVPMLVDTFIRLDYNTGEWKTFRTFRKLTQQQQQNEATAQQPQNSVVIWKVVKKA